MGSQEENQALLHEEKGECYGATSTEKKEEKNQRNGENSNDSHQENTCNKETSTDDTIVQFSSSNRQGSNCLMKTLLFVLGNWDSGRNNRYLWCCPWFPCHFFLKCVEVVLYLFIRVLPLPSIAVLAIYLVCYFGRVNHLLIFLSFVSYWLSVISPQFMTLAYILKNWGRQSFPEDVGGAQLFLKKHVYNSSSEERYLLAVYLLGFIILVALRLVFYGLIIKDCFNGYDIFWAIVDVCSVLYYTFFCSFLFLQRISLEEMGYDYFKDIKSDLNDLTKGKKKVLEFFQQYKRVREVAMPWISMILFFSSLGVTAIFTWNYHSVPESPLALPKAKSCNRLCCAFTCDKVPILISNSSYRHWSNGTVLLRNFVMAGFALLALNGSDLKHVWDTFRLRLFTLYRNDNNAEFQDLIAFLDCIHTESGIDSMGMAFSIAGFMVGILGSEFR